MSGDFLPIHVKLHQITMHLKYTKITFPQLMIYLNSIWEHPLRMSLHKNVTKLRAWRKVKVNNDIPKTSLIKTYLSATNTLFIFKMCWILLIKTLSFRNTINFSKVALIWIYKIYWSIKTYPYHI